MTQGPQCEGAKLPGLRQKIQRLGKQDPLTIHADKGVKRPHNREDKISQLQEKLAHERWARNGPKIPWAGRSMQTGPACFCGGSGSALDYGCFGLLIVSVQKFGGIHPQELGET
jgi:hypothetical protein